MDDKQCLLVIVGVTEDSNKELFALEDGYRESEQNWTGVLWSTEDSVLGPNWLLECSEKGLPRNPRTKMLEAQSQ